MRNSPEALQRLQRLAERPATLQALRLLCGNQRSQMVAVRWPRAAPPRGVGRLLVVMVVVVVLGAVAGPGAVAQEPGSAAGGGGPENPNPLAFLVDLGPAERRAFMRKLGEGIQEDKGLPCNPMGGAESCMAIPPGSKLAKFCPRHDLRVDCALYNETMLDNEYDPAAHFSTAEFETPCPACDRAFQNAFCSNALPKCGTYEKVIEPTVVDLLGVLAKAGDSKLSEAVALALELPEKLPDLSLGCREACQAVVDTCGCGMDVTVGHVVRGYAASVAETLEMPYLETMVQTLFSTVDAMPLCAGFKSKEEEGWFGHCFLEEGRGGGGEGCPAAYCTQADAAEKEEALELIGTELVRSTLYAVGLTADAPTGVLEDFERLKEDGDAMDDLKERHAATQAAKAHGPHAPRGLGKAVVTGIGAAVALVVVFGACGYVVSKRLAARGDARPAAPAAMGYTEIEL